MLSEYFLDEFFFSLTRFSSFLDCKLRIIWWTQIHLYTIYMFGFFTTLIKFDDLCDIYERQINIILCFLIKFDQ